MHVSLTIHQVMKSAASNRTLKLLFPCQYVLTKYTQTYRRRHVKPNVHILGYTLCDDAPQSHGPWNGICSSKDTKSAKRRPPPRETYGTNPQNSSGGNNKSLKSASSSWSVLVKGRKKNRRHLAVLTAARNCTCNTAKGGHTGERGKRKSTNAPLIIVSPLWWWDGKTGERIWEVRWLNK